MKVTAEARRKLEAYVHGDLKGQVPALLWSLASAHSHSGEWIVGFYDRSKIVTDWLVSVDGCELYVDPADLPKLRDTRLDFRDGRFFFDSDLRHGPN